ncbi:protein tilB homolog isoform X7 [Carcharodon carcharias]|uniref:protein tilB homolog isoform X7 n=1 Tax=Carcharodon carcharias TaxID=13397 RepID=UPI001B7E84F0|nr:protein tilB homolog isoform X7 [Carcharodon carcharias]
MLLNFFFLITETLIRQRAEHNNCEIFSLEEISLHQQEIERIEHIDKWCRDLKIVYFQNNLIPKIGGFICLTENVGRLKKLEYLNLALNNIERIENLDGCEFLKKLDLTVNFVGELTSVESLKHNVHLHELFLVGNPCCEFDGYRKFVIATLPQLKSLDGKEITRSEQIQALQDYPVVQQRVVEQQQAYILKRAKEKHVLQKNLEEKENNKLDHGQNTENKQSNSNGEDDKDQKNVDEDEMNRKFWEEPTQYTPESRLEVHRHIEKIRKFKDKDKNWNKQKPRRTLITSEGRVLNVNEPKHMDTSLLDIDVQPTYVRVMVKRKTQEMVKAKPKSTSRTRSATSTKPHPHVTRTIQDNEKLEVDPSKHLSIDLSNIVTERKSVAQGPLKFQQQKMRERNSADFQDNPEVPPLMD